MYEEQCESSIRLLDSELTVTAAWPEAHGQLVLERATKHAIGNRAYCSLVLILFFLTVGAFSVRRTGVLGRSRAYLVPYSRRVPTKYGAIHPPSKSAVFSIQRLLGCYYYGTSIPRSSQDIPDSAALKCARHDKLMLGRDANYAISSRRCFSLSLTLVLPGGRCF